MSYSPNFRGNKLSPVLVSSLGTQPKVLVKSSAYDITPNDDTILVDASIAPVTVTLPLASGNPNIYRIIKIDGSSNIVTIAASGSDTVDGAATKTLINPYDASSLASDNISHWYLDSLVSNSPAGITQLTGDVTALGPGSAVATITNSAITNIKMANMANNTVKANKSGGSAAPSDVALGSLTEAISSVLTITGGLNSTVGSVSIQVAQASGSASGYLSSTDWTTFNNKQAAGSYITALVGDVAATGPGSVSSTIQANTVTNSKLAQMPAHTIKGNNTGSTANALDLTVSQVNTLLGDVTTIGTFNGQAASANGAVISSNSIFFQSASDSNPGMVDNTTQSFSGDKNFSGAVTIHKLLDFIQLTVTGTLSQANPVFLVNDTDNDHLFTVDINGNGIFSGTVGASNFSGSSSGTNTGDQTITLTSDVTGSGTGSFATTIAAGAVTLAKMANLAANSIIGNNTGSPATPLALTTTQVTAMLNQFSSSLQGVVPASGGGTTNFLRADGAWAVAGSGSVTTVSVASANGFAGTVANPTTTPAITIQTSITGVIKGNGTAISAATSGTDYSAGTSALATGILKSTTSTGALTIAVAGDFPTLNQDTTGTANKATLVATTATNSTNASFFPTFVASSSSGNQGIDTATGLSFNPSTNTLTTTTFAGALTGTASGNTTYTANNHGVVISGSGNAMTVIAPDASTSKVLVSGGSSADPSWSLLTNSNLSGSAAITNANLAAMASSSSTVGTVKGNISGASAVPSDLVLTSANTASSVPYRDSSGNFSAGTITAALTGTASGNTTYTANNHGVVLSGSGNAMTVIAPNASTAFPLVSGGTGADPTWALLTEAGGGTNQSTYTTGDQLYASASNTLSKLAIGSTGALQSVQGGIPAWTTVLSTLNYIGNTSAEVNTTGWATYSNTAANIPSNGTGGTATGLTFSRSTSSPLAGAASFSLVQANSTSLQGKGVSYDFTIDSAYQAQVLQITFNYNASSTFIASNGTTAPLNDGTTTTNAGNSDIEVFIYDKTNAALIPVASEVITGNGSNNFVFKGIFQTSPSSTSYRLILHVATTSANATGWTFKYDNVNVGPLLYAGAPVIQDWVSFTPTGSFVTNATYTGRYRRTGDSLDFDVAINFSGNTTSTTMTVNLPSGFTIDTSRLANGTATDFSNRLEGGIIILTGSGWAGPVTYHTTTSIEPLWSDTNGNMNTVTQASPATVVNGTVMTLSCRGVPIVGWSSNAISSADTDSRVVAMFTSGQPTGTINGSFNVTKYPAATNDTHGGYASSTGLYTVPVSGYYSVTGSSDISASWTDATQGVTIGIFKNSTQIVNNLQLAVATSTTDYQAVVHADAILCVAGDTLSIKSAAGGGSPSYTSSANTNYFTVNRLSGPATVQATESVNARYYASSTTISGTLATVSWTTKDYDSHSGMSSGTYTCPTSGKYQVNAALLITGTIALNNTGILEIQKNGTVVSRYTDFFPATLTDGKLQISDIINCLAGDTLRIQVSTQITGPSIVSSNFDNYMSLARVGN